MIYETGILSLIIQFTVGMIDIFGLTFTVSPSHEILRDLLKVELVVQAIEFAFYVWLIFYFHSVSKNITPYRYADWSITTPLMLITLAAFLKHDGSKSWRLFDFIKEYLGPLIHIVILNAGMLLFGYLGEIGAFNPYVSTALGFIPFGLNFAFIYEKFVGTEPSKSDTTMFYWFLFFWSLYGVFALFPYAFKNAGYNILDLFSKNFFGLFLAFVLWQRSKVHNKIEPNKLA